MDVGTFSYDNDDAAGEFMGALLILREGFSVEFDRTNERITVTPESA